MRQLVYHDEPGKPSPRSYIDSLNPDETASIDLKLEKMRELPFLQWPSKWRKRIEKDLLQLRYGNHRLLYFVTSETIIVVHAVRKMGRKLNRADKDLALERIENYRDRFIR